MNTNIFIQQLDSILQEFNQFKLKAQHSDLSDLPTIDRQALVTRAISAIHRITTSNSTYAQDLSRTLTNHKSIYRHMEPIMGIIHGLRHDLTQGYINNIVETIHSNIFSDFIEMAQHLCDNRYKDAAAVIVGSTLESHLRALCEKWGVSIEISKSDGHIVPKKADALNSDLASKNAYNKLDQKNVTAWLDLRNNAAHGKYDQYTQDQVSFLLAGVRDFIVRNPA